MEPAAQNQAMILLHPAENHPVSLRGIELQPKGASGASAPLMLDFATCADTTGMSNDSSAIVKLGDYSESIVCQAWKHSSGNPGTPARLWTMTLHQQGGGFLWRPMLAHNEFVLRGNLYYVIRWATAVTGIVYRLQVWCEE